jgi:threonyl-tRNA synthetase
MQKKIRNAQLQKIPYMLVVGDREQEQGAAAVRLRSGVDLKALPLGEIIARMTTEIETRSDLPTAS